MPNTNPCPTCHAQLDPNEPHNYCAHTKAPTTRDLEARIAMLEQEDAATNARLEALERAKENTGAARGDGSERQPSDSHGSPAPDKGGCGTKHGEPSTQALGELRSVEACGKAPVTVAYTEHGGGGHAAQSARNETTEQSVAQPPSAAASALPMPERPDDLDEPWLERHFMCDSINLNEERNGNVRSAEAARLYALSLESRLAAAENTNTGAEQDAGKLDEPHHGTAGTKSPIASRSNRDGTHLSPPPSGTGFRMTVDAQVPLFDAINLFAESPPRSMARQVQVVAIIRHVESLVAAEVAKVTTFRAGSSPND